MKREALVYLNDILESLILIEEYVAGYSESDFEDNKLLQDAVIRRLEIIGEAVKNISPEIKIKHNEVEWKLIPTWVHTPQLAVWVGASI